MKGSEREQWRGAKGRSEGEEWRGVKGSEREQWRGAKGRSEGEGRGVDGSEGEE